VNRTCSIGPKNERNRIKEEELSDLSEFDIVVTTYEILVSEVNFFRRKYVWTAVIVDEGHRLKNERSQFSEKLRLIACLSKVILSGTPLQNNLKELWAMLYYLAPDVFQSSKPFEEGFDLAKGHIDSAVLRRARKLLSVFMLRRLKEVILRYKLSPASYFSDIFSFLPPSSFSSRSPWQLSGPVAASRRRWCR